MRMFRAALVVLSLSLAACGGGAHGTSSGGPGLVPAGATRGAAGLVTEARTARIATAGARIEERASTSTGRAAQSATVGSSNTATADMPVPRPRTTPCVVPLFTGVSFADFSPKPYQFTPPAACPRPWAKVVLEADISVNAGRQFDRTATIGLGGATIYFGTTSEPSRTVARSWHVERDLTDLSALLATPQSGQVSIGNVVNSTYTGVLQGSAKLDFYPPGDDTPAPRVPDIVVPLADSIGNPVALQTSSDTLSRSFAPPPKVERAYLDVIAQSQIGDEFWYTCFPNDLAAKLNNCGNTAFRETEVAVDGRPAGVAPVYPWIYTGGIDPYLWRPIPGVQTLNFVPYRVDLTPFAGTFDDGASHQVALSVFNANHYFSVTGTLLLFLDPDAKGALSGALDSDTLAATPPVNVTEGGSYDASGNGSGTIDTSSRRDYVITGHVHTSHGLVSTEVRSSIAFVQHQDVVNSPTSFVQNIRQGTDIVAQSSSRGGGDRDEETGDLNGLSTFSWPLTLKFSYVVNSDNSSAQATSLEQGYVAHTERSKRRFASDHTNTVTTSDTLNFDPSGALTSTTGNASAQTYSYRDTTGTCYGRKVTSANGVVTTNAPTGC
ncbi:MAG: peptide-N(4)-(N-acetyl-beta-glucosaminyl)asparagine amidase [Candidatus Eremiobacteraeota bacterium]|nr:peptide-N(4)-(N-acetyl-beta-glucosaminyl)asparagine amidase [Candidatus Eremiobacteraeota bacterium]